MSLPPFAARRWLVASLACLTLILFSGLSSPSVEAAAPVGTVVELRGGVTVARESERVDVGPGDAIFETDRVLTGNDAMVKIALGDGSVLTIGANSEVALESYLIAPDRGRIGAVLDLVLGILRVTVTMSGDGAPFDVRTRAAVASARSTQWVVEATPEGSAVFVVEGVVAVSTRDANDSVDLGPGQGSDVAPGGRPSPPKDWGAARVEDVLARTGLH